MNKVLLPKEIVLRQDFSLTERKALKRFSGRLLEYTVRSSNIPESMAFLSAERGKVALVESLPPRASLAVPTLKNVVQVIIFSLFIVIIAIFMTPDHGLGLLHKLSSTRLSYSTSLWMILFCLSSLFEYFSSLIITKIIVAFLQSK